MGPADWFSKLMEQSWRRGCSKDNRIGSAERAQGIAQAGGRQQSVVSILRRYQNNVEVAGQRAMLKPIIQQVNLRAELRFGERTGAIAVFAHNYRRLQTPGDQQRLVAEFHCRS